MKIENGVYEITKMISESKENKLQTTWGQIVNILKDSNVGIHAHKTPLGIIIELVNLDNGDVLNLYTNELTEGNKNG